MIRKFKTLGLALVAVLAMSAVVASAASAQFTASSYPKSATATSSAGNDDFITEAGKVQCHGAFAVGPLNAASTSVTVKPTYTGCTAFGFGATVHMNGCDYDFTDVGTNTEVKVDVVCPVGAKIVITAGPCTAEVPAQAPEYEEGKFGLGNVTAENSGSNVKVQAKVKGITYNVTNDGFLCPFNGTGHKAGAEYIQNEAVTVTPTGGGSISID